MAAADHTVRRTADGRIDKGVVYKSIEAIGAGAPGVADLAADIDAGPGEDRRRREIDRRRRAGRKIGRERRRSSESDGTNRCQEKSTIHMLCPFRLFLSLC